MNKVIHKPHELVLIEVRRRWACERYKGLLRRLIEMGRIHPKAIIITQTNSYDEKDRICSGETLHRWRYDNAGLQLLSQEEESQQSVDYCYYCIDKDKRKLVIDWSVIFQPGSSRKNIRYHQYGTVYEITKNDGIDDFELVSTWME